jgi:hypothetical protein
MMILTGMRVYSHCCAVIFDVLPLSVRGAGALCHAKSGDAAKMQPEGCAGPGSGQLLNTLISEKRSCDKPELTS